MFIAIDLLVSGMLIDLMSTSVPPEKLPRLRKARNTIWVLLGISVVVLCPQIARKHGWI